MNFLIILSCLFAAVYADKCFPSTEDFCKDLKVDLKNCGARYGHAEHVKSQLQNYVNLHLQSTFNYLLMMTNFRGYEKNREGLEKLFRHLSDRTWNDAIELIKYMNKRGIKVTWDGLSKKKISGRYKGNEIQSLAYALDTQKNIANDAIKIHELSSDSKGKYDPEVASFMENHFLHHHADVIRNLAGLTTDLKSLIGQPDVNKVSVFLFDEYLKKLS